MVKQYSLPDFLEKAKSIGMDVAEEILSKAGDNFIISETKLAHTIYKKSE